VLEVTVTDERTEFIEAQRRMLDRFGVEARSRFVEVPSIGGRAHVLESGEGLPVVLVNGIGTPGAMWAPLMAQLDGFRLLVVDLPAYGLTDTTPRIARDLRSSAVRFLDEVLDALALYRPLFVASSLGSLWVSWLALDRPERVAALVHVGCPAMALGTSAPLPMRLLSIRPLGRLLTRLQPPSKKQVEGLSKMVREYPLPPELVDLLVATERLPGFRETFLATLHALLPRPIGPGGCPRIRPRSAPPRGAVPRAAAGSPAARRVPDRRRLAAPWRGPPGWSPRPSRPRWWPVPGR